MMRNKATFVFLLVCSLFAYALGDGGDQRFAKRPYGQPVPLATGGQTFENTPQLCATNDSCDLKKVLFRKEDYIIPPDPGNPYDQTIMSTRVLFGLITDDVEHLTRYAFVQFTRGCMWYSWLNDDGVLETEYGLVRNFLGLPKLQHIFPNWVVDSRDLDPAYGSDSDSGDRHFNLQSLPAVPEWIPLRPGILHSEALPVIPFGYLTDAPGPAYYNPALNMAANMSLEFKTCLFKTTDVPLRTDGIDFGPEGAIVCFTWESKHVFDHATHAFKSPKGIHPECKRPFNAREKNFHLEQIDKIEK